ncbi:MAG: hypothetical protein HC804_12610 [Anaerolineae bacterium]|nr:hypothetical protein [Anaerolineae bacterium]
MADAAIGADAQGGGISRREFLYYIWGASIALYLAQFAGLMIWFLIPRFREGEFWWQVCAAHCRYPQHQRCAEWVSGRPFLAGECRFQRT